MKDGMDIRELINKLELDTNTALNFLLHYIANKGLSEDLKTMLNNLIKEKDLWNKLYEDNSPS